MSCIFHNLSELHLKHLNTEPKHKYILLYDPKQFVDDAVFKGDAECIQKAASNTRGAPGPSSLDTDGWHRILLSKTCVKQ